MVILLMLSAIGLMFLAMVVLGIDKIRGGKKLLKNDIDEEEMAEGKLAGPYRTQVLVDNMVIEFDGETPLPDPLDGFLSAEDVRRLAREKEASKIAAYRKERREIWNTEVVPDINSAIEDCKNEVSLHGLGTAKSKVLLELAKELGYEAKDCLTYDFIEIRW